MGEIYSFHTFLFPFAWENEEMDMVELFSNGSKANIWEIADTSMKTSNFSKDVYLKEMDPMEYNEFHYFNEAARNLVFSDNENCLVHNFKISNRIIADTEYIITKGETSYILDISDVYLHIFSTDIAIFEIKCRNTLHHDMTAVKAINEFGRRLALPFWPNAKNGFSKCADSLEIKGPYLNERDDFKSYKNDKVSFCYVSKVFRLLLDKNGMGRVFRARRAENENEIQIRTIVDEKMFDCCLINDKELADKLCDKYEKNGGKFDCDTEASLSELIYVETEGSYRNKNNRVLKDKLYNCLYLDDLENSNPKLTAVTDQAYIKIIGNADYDIEYFENIYTKIILLGLVQRMSVAKFSTRINKWTNALSAPKKKITMSKVRSVTSLQKQFVTFQNQYILSEITVKAEGRFLYDSIREKLNIHAEYSDIVGQISSLYKLVSTVQGNAFNKWGLVLSLIAMEMSVIGEIITANSFAEIDFASYNGWYVILTEVVIAAVIIWLVIGVIFNRKDK